MEHPYLVISLILLILLSAFFSCAETAMMAVNRYRIRHLVRKNVPGAKRVSQLLEHPDQVLSITLIGDTFADIAASAVATILAFNYFGERGIFPATLILTLLVLIFGEITPKTLAVLQPVRLAFFFSWPLKILIKILYPMIIFTNSISHALLRIFRVETQKKMLEPVSIDELRTIVHEAGGKIASGYQQLLLRILDLEKVTVEDVMIPRDNIIGIDIDDSWDEILKQLTAAKHSHLPIYHGKVNNILGILDLRKVLSVMQSQPLDKNELKNLMEEVYYIPEGAPLSRQVLHFHDEQQSIGLVVDEYGEIQGLLTISDVLSEMIGEMTPESSGISRFIKKQKDGSLLVDARINIRDLNRMLHWNLPMDGPKTLSGLIIEYLEIIPETPICVKIEEYSIEVKQMSKKRIDLVQIWPGVINEGQ